MRINSSSPKVITLWRTGASTASEGPPPGVQTTLSGSKTAFLRSSGMCFMTRPHKRSPSAAYLCLVTASPRSDSSSPRLQRMKARKGRRWRSRPSMTITMTFLRNEERSINSPVVRRKHMLKRNWMRLAAALLAAIANFVTVPNAVLAAAPQHHDQAPGFYRLKVRDHDVTALYDGTGVFDPHWLNGTKATMDRVVQALHEDPHMLDVVDTGFLVNTGKQLILVDAGAGAWWGGGALGRLPGSLRSAGYAPEEVDIVLVTHLHSDHVGGLTTQDGKR